MGVQTTALYYMSSVAVFERADIAIFADTGAEHPGTYVALQQMLDWQKKNDGIPVIVVADRNIKTDILRKRNSSNYRWASIPAFSNEGKGRLPRQCTAEYKIEQVRIGLRRYYKLKPFKWLPPTEVWLGITKDEAHRVKDSKSARICNRWPLIEMMWSRQDCKNWLAGNGFVVPPKSACIFCPFKSDHSWQQLATTEPTIFKEAVRLDKAIRNVGGGLRFPIYLHKSCKPLGEIDFEPDTHMDTFGEECDGVCGT